MLITGEKIPTNVQGISDGKSPFIHMCVHLLSLINIYIYYNRYIFLACYPSTFQSVEVQIVEDIQYLQHTLPCVQVLNRKLESATIVYA